MRDDRPTPRRHRRSRAAIGILLALTATASVGGPSAAAGRPTVLQILQLDSATDGPGGYDGRWYDYDIVTGLLLAFDYERELLEDPAQPLTLFAPKDYAFFRLARQAGAPALAEDEVVDWLFANIGPGPIEDALLVHIELSRLSAEEMRAADGRELAGGAVIDVRSEGRIKLVDLDPNDRDAYVIAPDHGGAAANGYVHGIGRVLRPFDMP